jgi:hypothetical protein
VTGCDVAAKAFGEIEARVGTAVAEAIELGDDAGVGSAVEVGESDGDGVAFTGVGMEAVGGVAGRLVVGLAAGSGLRRPAGGGCAD